MLNNDDDEKKGTVAYMRPERHMKMASYNVNWGIKWWNVIWMKFARLA